MVERVLKHVVHRCPLCRQGHEYFLVVRGKEPAPLLFGGPEPAGIAAPCPTTGDTFSISPRLGDGETVAEIRSADNQEPTPTPRDEDPEYADWLKTSRATALDFGKTMLTTSAGAVAIYFAILKYLGTEKIARSLAGWISVTPPLLFLASVALFGWALRPRLDAVTRSDFPIFRDNRMRQLNRLLTAGTGLFVLALALTFVVFAWVLAQS